MKKNLFNNGEVFQTIEMSLDEHKAMEGFSLQQDKAKFEINKEKANTALTIGQTVANTLGRGISFIVQKAMEGSAAERHHELELLKANEGYATMKMQSQAAMANKVLDYQIEQSKQVTQLVTGAYAFIGTTAAKAIDRLPWEKLPFEKLGQEERSIPLSMKLKIEELTKKAQSLKDKMEELRKVKLQRPTA